MRPSALTWQGDRITRATYRLAKPDYRRFLLWDAVKWPDPVPVWPV